MKKVTWPLHSKLKARGRERTTLWKIGVQEWPQGDPNSDPLRGGQVSENTRKTKLFCSFSHIQVATFGAHFGCPFGVVPWAPLFMNLIKFWCPVDDSNGLLAGIWAQIPLCFTRNVNEITFKEWMSKKVIMFLQESTFKKWAVTTFKKPALTWWKTWLVN